MPTEKHYWAGQAENDGRGPNLTITWRPDANTLTINGYPLDQSAVDRLIKNLKRARRQIHG